MTPTMHLTQFGRYEIIRKLSRSMTDVYLALDPETNRRVVLKLVEHSKDSYTQLVVEAERRGALIQQQLHSKDPRILEVFEYGDQNGCFFVAMQYAEGQSLAEVIRKERRFEAMKAARFAAEICSQLETLHSFEADIEGQRRAVVHGDIKPSNIQIGPNGEVWLLDFGIAKVITATRNLTQHNLGSPAYCSPQRLKSGNVDPFSDLWALGVCLYEMVAGLPPYQAQTTRKLESLIQSRRPPRDLPQDCPAALRAIIRKTIAAEPERRYASAHALGQDLQLFLEGKRPLAEGDHEASWDANATVEKPRQNDQTRSRMSVLRVDVEKTLSEISVMMWCLLAGLVIGLICFVPAAHFYRFWTSTSDLRAQHDYVDSDWSLYQSWKHRYASLGRMSPASFLDASMRTRTAAAGNAVLDRFRDSTESGINQYDWERAKTCFSHLLEMEPGSPEWKGKLAAAEGFLQLSRVPVSPRNAEAKFREAIRFTPKLVAPHLGLAIIYVYDMRNTGLALAEFHAAENLGYRLGPRENEQQADAYLYRAEQEFSAWRHASTAGAKQRLSSLMQRDLARARELYEPIAGYSKVNDSLERLDRDDQRFAFTRVVHVTKPRKRRWR